MIVADLDNTLLKTDSLHEQLLQLCFGKPWLLAGLVRAFLSGRAAVKAYCADHITLDPAVLNTCSEVLAFLKAERETGSLIVLCTAADRRVAAAIAQHLGIFDEVIGTDSQTNLKGHAKAMTLKQRYPEGFVYIGDHASDLHVWAAADGIVLAGTSPRVAAKARALGKPVLGEFRLQRAGPKPWTRWARALRVHHWSKNVLMFVPLALSHQWANWSAASQTCMGFVLLLALTSASYLINDLADLDADRRHATKRNRPIASGAIPISVALTVAAVAIPVALGLALLLNPIFFALCLAYLGITLAYSLRLKRIPLLDTFIIGLLFTTRIVMGAAFVSTSLPIWLLTFSMFFFFSLAMAKRHTEVLRARDAGGDSLASRGYRADDWPLTLNMGVTSGLASLIILVLYMVDEAFRVVGYQRPEFLWAIVLCLAIWIGRIWLLTHRGQMNDDPVSFALRDRPSRLIAVAVAALFLIAL